MLLGKLLKRALLRKVLDLLHLHLRVARRRVPRCPQASSARRPQASSVRRPRLFAELHLV